MQRGKAMDSELREKQRARPRWSLLPLRYIGRHSILRHEKRDLSCLADRTWNITKDEATVSRPAYFLPGQIERITGTMFTGDVRTEMLGGVKEIQNGARAYLINDAILLDGGIYKADACRWLGPRQRKSPRFRIDNEVSRGSAYSSYNGNVYFGMWLLDDCATYRLAEHEGMPININAAPSAHTVEYEKWLDMKPARLDNAYLRQVIIYDDLYQTKNKRMRCRDNARRLLAKVDWNYHPGVFILRRDTGVQRKLHNELELAAYFKEHRGFRIVDITTMSVPEIVSACAGARVVMGIEGSHLIHGIMVLEPGCSVLTLQPPDRFCSCIKRVADPDGQHFSFVVGTKLNDGFIIDPEEVERTLDLLPKPTHLQQHLWNMEA